jgi:branched-chain amino acid aminotransferase
MGDVCFINGVQVQQAALPLTDIGVLRGYGVFDFTRTYQGKPWHLEDHIARLFHSATAIDITPPWSLDAVIKMVHDALRQTTHAECFIRLLLTAGDGLNAIVPGDTPRLVVMLTAATAPPNPESDNGLKVITVNQPRYLPGVKSLNYIPAVRALKQARAAGADDALYINDARYIDEATTANLFIVKQGSLYTPPLDNALKGITRDVVRGIANDIYPVKVQPLHYDDLLEADEVFITSSSRQIMPVVVVDSCIIHDGKPGTITRDLMRRFDALTGGHRG